MLHAKKLKINELHYCTNAGHCFCAFALFSSLLYRCRYKYLMLLYRKTSILLLVKHLFLRVQKNLYIIAVLFRIYVWILKIFVLLFILSWLLGLYGLLKSWISWICFILELACISEVLACLRNLNFLGSDTWYWKWHLILVFGWNLHGKCDYLEAATSTQGRKLLIHRTLLWIYTSDEVTLDQTYCSTSKELDNRIKYQGLWL